VNRTVTTYVLHGKNVVHLTQGSNNLHFFYGADGSPAVVEYNGVSYGYVKNLQGDVIGIVNASGAYVVQYAYDAWGRLLSKTGSMASTLGSLNPFRYRGYVYDEETGLYYLRSRYYNPVWDRFVNADTELVNNIFTYCSNKPVNRQDYDGKSDGLALGVATQTDLLIPGMPFPVLEQYHEPIPPTPLQEQLLRERFPYISDLGNYQHVSLYGAAVSRDNPNIVRASYIYPTNNGMFIQAYEVTFKTNYHKNFYSNMLDFFSVASDGLVDGYVSIPTEKGDVPIVAVAGAVLTVWDKWWNFWATEVWNIPEEMLYGNYVYEIVEYKLLKKMEFK